ncbi:hypothetical protein [Pontibacter sp. H249]|uniref:hypothetical protein n=1 Tax=Pontibacter sp. H249 TaxID=3133420 RepID=UPI0030C53A32
MNFLHLTYYIIFKYYNKGEDPKTYSPLGRATIIYTVVFTAQFLGLTILVIYLQDPYVYFNINRLYVWTTLIVSAGLAYLLFVRHGKTSKIYHHYNNKPWADTSYVKVAVWLYVLLSIISPFLIIIGRNAAIGRHLV